jgi:hypothetical protein
MLPRKAHAKSLIKTPTGALSHHQSLQIGSACPPNLICSSRDQSDRDRLATPTGCHVHVENFTPTHAVV